MENKTIDIDIFNQMIKSGVTVIDFSATWCQPCALMHPIFDELTKDYDKKALFLQIDVDENPELCDKYFINSIPAIFIIKDGEVKEKVIGYHLKRELVPLIEKYI